MRRACPFLILLLLALTPTARAEVAPEHRATIEFRLLERATVFTSDAVGYGGDTPATVHALRLLVGRPDARAVLLDLARAARHPAGRLFALAGLRVVDPVAFGREAKAIRRAGGEVRSIQGCFGTSASVEACVDALEQGALARALCRPERPTPTLTVDAACALLLGEGAGQLDAVRALAAHGATAVPPLREALRDPSPRRRAAAAWAFEGLGHHAVAALPELVTCLEDPDDAVASHALDALGHLGPWLVDHAAALHAVVARAALPPRRLVRALWRLHDLVRAHCLLEPDRLPAFVRPVAPAREGEDDEAAEDEDDLFEMSPRYALAGIPPKAVEVLARALGDPEDHVRDAVRDALERWAEGAPAIEALLRALEDSPQVTRRRIVQVLGVVGRRPDDRPPVVDALRRLLERDEDEMVRVFSEEALEALTGERPAARDDSGDE
ncbi:MAG: HEAT repeat domain-containing protein [Planctomycetes bacterium]|nr:HEAT repeat domain-containing protein [Planctomycetota bacterium]